MVQLLSFDTAFRPASQGIFLGKRIRTSPEALDFTGVSRLVLIIGYWHTAATNMHQLTGDFYTVGQILGHSLKGVGIQLGMGSNLESVTAQYVDVRLDRKRIVLEAYHNEVLKGK